MSVSDRSIGRAAGTKRRGTAEGYDTVETDKGPGAIHRPLTETLALYRS